MDKEKMNRLYEIINKTGYIQSINIFRKMGAESEKEYNLALVISSCPYNEGDIIVKILFHNVQEFKLGNIDNFYRISLEILDVSERMLEEIRYYVSESEYNMISFACSEWEYEIVN